MCWHAGGRGDRQTGLLSANLAQTPRRRFRNQLFSLLAVLPTLLTGAALLGSADDPAGAAPQVLSNPTGCAGQNPTTYTPTFPHQDYDSRVDLELTQHL